MFFIMGEFGIGIIFVKLVYMEGEDVVFEVGDVKVEIGCNLCFGSVRFVILIGCI